MSYVDDIVGTIQVRLEELEKGLALVEAAVLTLELSMSREGLTNIPGWEWVAQTVITPLISLARNCVHAFRDAIAFWRVEIAFAGSPDNLRAAADLIDAKLVKVAKEFSPTLVLSKIPSALDSNYSDGKASEMYEHAIDGRDAAVLAIADHSSPVVSGLRTLADGIESYYLEVMGMVGGAILTISGIVLALLTVQTALASVGATGLTGGAASPSLLIPICTGAAAAANLIGGAIVLFVAISGHANTVGQVKDSIKRNLGETVPNWPAAVTG
ncbi:hypothetical protein G7066_01220 [Leucobacter coleopterorum]|uniref:Uncharacterized protein n=1 Tax=Leucobacter coleopterorum TaxID=2714933 RepID=A0ABX6JTP8_9MICO|nr:hypothetical protein [Leucobacter coleopterorum]QIM17667.1 hypothetical protein G7066_01220 [Leucobacter coleopterorum]